MDAIVHKDGEGGPECTPHTNALPSDARLHVAVIAGQPRDVQTLLDAGCDPLFRFVGRESCHCLYFVACCY